MYFFSFSFLKPKKEAFPILHMLDICQLHMRAYIVSYLFLISECVVTGLFIPTIGFFIPATAERNEDDCVNCWWGAMTSESVKF